MSEVEWGKPESWRTKKYLSVSEIADVLSISRRTAVNIIQQQLPYVRAGRLYRVPMPAFEQWLRNQERKNK